MKPPKRPIRPALGRGLGALIPNRAPEPSNEDGAVATSAPAPASRREGLRTVAIEQLRPCPDQPRRIFDPNALAELAQSITNHGIIQPIVVSPIADARGEYQIIAGERRWRAAQLAALHEVPVVIRDTPESERLELAVIENLQRQDLNPIEEAQAFRQLMEVRAYTQEQLASRLGKDRSTISNALRLLKLPPRVQEYVQRGTLAMGHARALLGLEAPAEMIELAEQVIRGGLSVRATEREVRKRTRPEPEAPEPDAETRKREVIVRELEQRLRRSLGVRVQMRADKKRAGAGVIEVPYGSLDELDRLLHIFLEQRS
ncbi:MAG: ParB/RepB/Spo0J family partition protein [Myxococcales bacterium]|nr:ParB/RepB/Spo0J family partition protein [Myxococcales bacterium]